MPRHLLISSDGLPICEITGCQPDKKMYRTAAVFTTGVAVVTVVMFNSGDFFRSRQECSCIPVRGQ